MAERAKVHWLLNVGAALITLGVWWPANLCTDCQGKVSVAGAIGLLLTVTVLLAIGFKLLASALA